MISKTEEFVMSAVLGQRILRIRPMSPDESRGEHWEHRPDIMILELGNGAKLYAPVGVNQEHAIYGQVGGRRFKI